jgi:parvulin-like peptidyl-prolyl isomerase
VAPHRLRTRTRADETVPALPHDHPVAMVKGALIMKSDVEYYLRIQEPVLRYKHRSDTEPAALEAALARLRREAPAPLIDQQILIYKFWRMGAVMKPGDVEEEIQRLVKDSFNGDREALTAELKRNGSTYESFRRTKRNDLIVGIMRTKLAGDISAEEYYVRDYFDENKRRWTAPDQVKIHTLSMPRYNAHKTDDELRRHAESVHARIAAGAEMAALARAESQDSHAERGGEWDWMPLNSLTPHLSAALLKLKKGGISPLLREESTYIILRLDDRKPSAPPRYEDIHDEVRSQLEQEMREKHLRKKIDAMRSDAEVQYLDPV